MTGSHTIGLEGNSVKNNIFATIFLSTCQKGYDGSGIGIYDMHFVHDKDIHTIMEVGKVQTSVFW